MRQATTHKKSQLFLTSIGGGHFLGMVRSSLVSSPVFLLRLALPLVLCPAVLAQLANGKYPLTDNLNGIHADASATASTLPSGTQLLTVAFNPGGNANNRKVVTLAWSVGLSWYITGSNEAPLSRFRWVTVEGVRYYWYEVLDNSGDGGPAWVTESSGTF